MDIRLHDNLGTCKTFDKVRDVDNLTSPVPAMGERDPSAILTFLFPAQGLYEEKRLEEPVI